MKVRFDQLPMSVTDDAHGYTIVESWEHSDSWELSPVQPMPASEEFEVEEVAGDEDTAQEGGENED